MRPQGRLTASHPYRSVAWIKSFPTHPQNKRKKSPHTNLPKPTTDFVDLGKQNSLFFGKGGGISRPDTMASKTRVPVAGLPHRKAVVGLSYRKAGNPQGSTSVRNQLDAFFSRIRSLPGKVSRRAGRYRHRHRQFEGTNEWLSPMLPVCILLKTAGIISGNRSTLSFGPVGGYPRHNRESGGFCRCRPRPPLS